MTWYIDEYSFNPSFNKQIDDIVHAPKMWDEALGLKMGARSTIIAGRAHGNPKLETTTIGWQESPARMRAQDEVYRKAISAGDQKLAFQELFNQMPAIWKTSGGFLIIDADDPMLVEKGEDFVHYQFTDYMSDNVCLQRDDWDELCCTYLFRNLFLNLEKGVVPAGVVMEPLRQLFGFPFEWYGAPVE